MTDYAATKLTEMFVEGPDVVLRPLCALLCQLGCFISETHVDAGRLRTLRYAGVLARFCPL
ncbi:hypothetical protein [Xanthomonas campestris]|jgi:hypothetical protein|nr:hypothetical protein [Xanthomonas campestris]AKS18832.1 hypothetical protein AEA01_02035 [Xanthomonas campestris pv. campestris]ALE67363.1 hypothetical protein AAW18_02010 [Xanthomonas campestris pv. campestris]MBF9171867.1 hypothetical protein [Xanthomonas campestris pv. campestris]MCC3255353.1 hypothetical protein [Xanthomonas campestris pv. armoraciae]MCC5053648.1 hypothetical protein [Xanthomonas campestris pv. aberrans]